MADRSPTEGDILRGNAEWAERFEGGTTNLALRARHNQDRLEYADHLASQREMQTAQDIQTDRVKQQFFFRSQELNLKERLAKDKMQRDQEAHTQRLSLMEQQEATSAAAEQARLTTMRAQEEVRRQTAEDTRAFSEGVAEAARKHRAGTPEYAQSVASLRANHPSVDKALFDDIWKTTNSDLTPEQVAENVRKAKAVAGNANVTATSTGNVTVSQNSGESAIRREIQTYENLRSRAVERLKKVGADDPSKKMLEEDVSYHAQKIGELESQLGKQAAPTVTTNGTVASTAQRPIFKDKSGNRAYKNPDGTFEPIP